MSGAPHVPGPGLYLVATPIGNARDITLRAIDVLTGADLLLAEDTRTLRKLMEIHGIPLNGRPIWAYHDHNGAAQRPKVLARIAGGSSVAFASDAGTPLVADPGYALARAVADTGHAVTALPGPSAPLAALSLAGLPSDRFLFAGFPPPAGAARRNFLTEVAAVPATLIFFESPRRILPMLKDCRTIFGNRTAALARELTKKFEEVRRGDLDALIDGCEADPPRGELVVLVDRDRDAASADDMEGALRDALRTMGVRDAAAFVSDALGVKKRDAYQMALRLSQSEETGGTAD